MGEPHLLEINIRQQVGIHDQYGLLSEAAAESDTTHRAESSGLGDTSYAPFESRVGAMVFQLLAQIIDSHENTFYSASHQCIDVMVDDSLAAYRE